MADLTTLLSQFLDRIIHGSDDGEVLTATGVNQLPAWEEAVAGGGGASILHQVTVTLTNAQIKALPTTAITIAGAPGANRITWPVTGLGVLDTSAGAYAADGDASWVLFTEGNYISAPVTVVAELQAAQVSIVQFQPAYIMGGGGFVGIPTGDRYDGPSITNKALQIKDDWMGVADYINGHASNTLTICVEFRVYDTVEKTFLTSTESGWNEATRTFS